MSDLNGNGEHHGEEVDPFDVMDAIWSNEYNFMKPPRVIFRELAEV